MLTACGGSALPPCLLTQDELVQVVQVSEPVQLRAVIPSRVDTPVLTGLVQVAEATEIEVDDCAGTLLLAHTATPGDAPLLPFWNGVFLEGCDGLRCEVTACITLAAPTEQAEVSIFLDLHEHNGTCGEEPGTLGITLGPVPG